MKKQRALPFGYAMQGGKIETVKAEARLVRRIFRMYEDGGSLESISKALAKQIIPYSDVNPDWNKHKVKRILENQKYIGQDSFPAILEDGLYERVKKLHAEKTQPWQSPSENPQKQVWKRLACADCGGRIKRVGGRANNVTLLECESCHKRIQSPTDTLLHTLAERFREATAPAQEQEVYLPTSELIKLENEVERGIQKPADGQKTRRLILEAAAKRYDLCPKPTQENPNAQLEGDAIWSAYKIQVETAVMKDADEITIQLKQERK